MKRLSILALLFSLLTPLALQATILERDISISEHDLGVSGGAAAGKVAEEAKDLLPVGDNVRFLYQKVGANGEHLKFGTTIDTATRYTKAELAGGRLRTLASGTPTEMNALERALHKTFPIGPEERQAAYINIQARNGLFPPPYQW